jgi:hypothetical protein
VFSIICFSPWFNVPLGLLSIDCLWGSDEEEYEGETIWLCPEALEEENYCSIKRGSLGSLFRKPPDLPEIELEGWIAVGVYEFLRLEYSVPLSDLSPLFPLSILCF